MWPLNPNDAKLQSGISKMQGSAMTKQAPTQRPRNEGARGGISLTSYPGSVELTIMLKLDMPLYKCLVANPPYPIISGVNDPSTKNVIDV
jgi:hypothetical protein